MLELRGSWVAKTREDVEAEPATPGRPEWLGPLATEAWERITPGLAALGVLALIDANALARYCRLWERWRELEIQIAKRGQVVQSTTPLGDEVDVISRFVQIADNLADKLLRLEHEFGMTPSGRASLGMLQKQHAQYGGNGATVSTRGRKPKPKAALNVG